MPPRLGRTSRRLSHPADPPAESLLDELPVVAIDLETTGGSPVGSRIVELAALRFVGGEPAGGFEELIDPLVPIPPEVSAIHGITDGMVRGKPRIEEVLPDLWRFLEGAVLLAHHAPFDSGFLAYEISKSPRETPANPILDTCRLPRRVFAGLPSYSLSSLCERFSIARERAHRAGEDARACHQVFRLCLARIEEEGAPARWGDLLQKHGPPLRFADFHSPWPKVPALRLLRRAARRSRPLRIVYASASGHESERWITPLAIGQYRGAVQVEAFCHALRARRTFRLDRMLEVDARMPAE